MLKQKFQCLCLFGFHEWNETTDINGDMTRRCIFCGKLQFIYKGDWYNLKKIK